MKNTIFKFDKSNMLETLTNFYTQVQEAVKIGNKLNLLPIMKNINNIILCGMGGSAIGGDILKSYLQNELKVPFLINRNYNIPEFIDKNSLVFISSYSGNTEETINALHLAKKRTNKIVCITSGGTLKKLALDNNFFLIIIPSGYQPRSALGFSFFPLLIFLSKLKIVKNKIDSIQETIELLKKLSEKYTLKNKIENNKPFSIAQKLSGKIPVIYSGSDVFTPVALRWKCQFCENSKVLAYHNSFPELDHNEITGWESSNPLLKKISVIILKDKDDTPEITERIKFTKEIISPHCAEILEFHSEGESLLARIFSLIYLGDFISYYLALLNHKDPTTIENIEILKKKLKNFKDNR
ncbi:bifunctional phosphoglucose/phosphomannose isomerase [candidate division KSB1 bacterium]|nr:MAG: bifunctional phosphoglucose/phosphomannose isomerase [candidate division KSB1 bacterium]